MTKRIKKSLPVLWLKDMEVIESALSYIQNHLTDLEAFKYEQTRQKILEFREKGIDVLGEYKI